MPIKFADATLPVKYGYPLRVPTRLGFKNPKWVTTIFVQFPSGFWEHLRHYNWFSGS